MVIPPHLQLGEELLRRARAAYERLRDQTLWAAHPASFYHSTAQELMVLAEFGVARCHGFRQIDASRVTTSKLEWKRSIELPAGPDGAGASEPNETTLLALRSLMPHPSSPVVLAIEAKLDEHVHRVKIELTVRLEGSSAVSPAESRGVERLLEALLCDLAPLFPRDAPSLFSWNMQDVVETARRDAEKKYAAAAPSGRPATVQIMLYHPGVRPDKLTDGDTNRPEDLGYLFYPVFHVGPWSWLTCGHLPSSHEAIVEGQPISRTTHKFILDPSKSASSLNEPARLLNWCYLAIEDAERAECLDFLKKRKDEALRLLDVSRRAPTGEGTGIQVDDAFAKVASFVLSYPPGHLESTLLPDARDGLPSGPDGTIVAKAGQGADPPPHPVVFQPRGMGAAGAVARDLVTRLIRRVSADSMAALSLRQDCLSYYLMGLLEAEWGVRADYSGIVTPLLGKGQLLGVLVAYRSNQHGEFVERDVEFFESIAGYVGRIIQEAKDQQFLHVMRSAWSRLHHSADNWAPAFDEWVGELARALPFVMNVAGVWKWGVAAASNNNHKPTELLDLTRGMPPPARPRFGKKREDRPAAPVDGWFCEWSANDADPQSYCRVYTMSSAPDIEPTSLTDTMFWVSAAIPGARERWECVLQLRLQEPPEVFNAHKEEIEILLNSCLDFVSAEAAAEAQLPGVSL